MEAIGQSKQHQLLLFNKIYIGDNHLIEKKEHIEMEKDYPFFDKNMCKHVCIIAISCNNKEIC